MNVFINIKNLFILLKIFLGKRNYKQNSIAFVVKKLYSTGGIETRLNYYCSLLEKDGFNVIIITKSNDNLDFKKYTTINLDIGGSNFFLCLYALTRLLKISLIEFQSVPDATFRFFDFDILRKKCLIGYVIHGTYLKVNYLNSNNFHYIISISDRLKNFYKNLIAMEIKVIPNAVPTESKNCFNYSGQNTALMITRICEEKLSTIRNFIDFCIQQKIPFKIAGSEAWSNHLIKYLKKQYSLASNVFIGSVNTNEFLAKNGNRFLFVAGVGQVALEAGAMGYPVFICSHLDINSSCFLSLSNIDFLKSENFTIKQMNGTEKFGLNRNQDLSDIKAGNISRFNLQDYINNNLSMESVFKDYRNFINALMKQKDG